MGDLFFPLGHPELVSGSMLPPNSAVAEEFALWMLKQVQHDETMRV
jgi:hypothetical protein